MLEFSSRRSTDESTYESGKESNKQCGEVKKLKDENGKENCPERYSK